MGTPRTVLKFHALRTDNRGKPLIRDRPLFKKPLGNNYSRSFQQQGRGGRAPGMQRERGRSQGTYHPPADIRDPMEGSFVNRPDQILKSTREILKRGGRCTHCFRPWSPQHSAECPKEGKLPSMQVRPRSHMLHQKHALNSVHQSCKRV